jgi:hypothetical protein
MDVSKGPGLRATGIPPIRALRGARQSGREGEPTNGRLPRSAARRAAIALAVLLGCTATATADEVTSKGTVLHGKVTGLSSSGITFQPEYGEGELTIEWANVEDIKTDVPVQVLYGEEQESDAPLQGLSDGKLLVGSSAATATRIDLATIYSGLPLGAGGPTFGDRMRSYWRYWDGSFDVGFNLQQATTDTTGFLLAFNTQRSKDPTRLILSASYRYGTQKEKDQDRTRTQDQLLGLVRGEYDFAPRIYGYASGDATYDGIQALSLRAVPKVGAGYVFWQEKLDQKRRNFLQADVGPSWVYEKYFGGSTNDYFAIAFGAQAGYYLPYDAKFDWRLDYLPAVDNFTSDYLLRTEAGLSVPLVGPIDAKFSLLDEYDSTPAPDTDRNSLFLTLGLSIGW